jgi:hypothetical protein
MPLAAKKLLGVRFPLTFEIGPEDAIRPGLLPADFEGELELSVFTRHSGLVDVPLKGDWISQNQVINLKNPSAKGLEIVLSAR